MTRPRDPRSKLAAFVKARRQELGLNKSEAYKKAGISRSAWHQIETGQTKKPQDGNINGIAHALKVSPPWLREQLRRDFEPWDSGPRWDEGVPVWDAPGASWMAEVKPALDAVAADRARVTELAATMSADQVRRLREFAETLLAS